MNKILYWSPFTSKVATVKSVINSVDSVNKYLNEKFKAIIVDAVHEWDDYKDELYKKHEILAKHIVEIDKIDKSTIELDHVVGILDEYTRRIEAKAQKFL